MIDVGDRVILKEGVLHIMKHETGTVVERFDSITGVGLGIDFDNEVPYGHTCEGKCRIGHGRYVSEKVVELIGGHEIKVSAEDIAAMLNI